MDSSVCRAGRVRSLSHRRAPIPAAGTQRSGPAPPRSFAAIDPRGGKGRPGAAPRTNAAERRGEKSPRSHRTSPAARLRSPRGGRSAASPPLGGARFPQPLPPGTRPTDGRPRAARPRRETARVCFCKTAAGRSASAGAESRNAARPRPPHRLQRCCRARLGAERGWRFADAAVEACSI